jgi:hypothetical protein
VALLLVVAGCTSGAPPAMDFRRVSFYDAPFPSDDLRRADDTIDLTKLPNPQDSTLMAQALALLAETHGFGLASAIIFRMGSAVDLASLPDVAGSTTRNASVMLVSVDATQPDYLQPRPIDVAFMADGGPFGDKNLLVLLPQQGVPLRPRARYAAVVTTGVRDAHGRAVAQASLGSQPGLSQAVREEYDGALLALEHLVRRGDIAAYTVFTTGDPAAQMTTVRDHAATMHPILPPTQPPALTDTFSDYCVYQTTVSVPVYQSGKPPYQLRGGNWTFDAAGNPIYDHNEDARLYITIPRRPMPASGWPAVVFVRTGGGGDRPLVDRGPAATVEFGTAVAPGTGPAMHFARVGFAGVQVDGPIGGLRNPGNGNEDFLIFNVENAAALRDNVRESAMELSLLARMLPALTLATPDCPGSDGGQQRIDGAHLALMGHSMGSWIEPLVLAVERRFGVAIMSGAGASYVANVTDKLKPLAVRPYAELLLGFTQEQRRLDAHDPALMLLQWAAEPSDPQVYDRYVVREPPNGAPPIHVLMLQGIVDHYILPSIADATSLALGLDQAGPSYDAGNAELRMLRQPTLAPLLPLVGARSVSLPYAPSAGATAVVVQHPGDAIEDGHEVVFQTEPPKHQYRCFLQSWRDGGSPRVPADRDAEAACQ